MRPAVWKTLVPYAAVILALFALPVSKLDSLPSICLFKNILGVQCPGCGITRAFLSVLHFRFAEALHYNRLITAVFPLAVFLFFRSLIKNLRNSLI